MKEVSDKEVRRLKNKERNKDKQGLTSQHHMAAEATIRKIKAFIELRRRGDKPRPSWGTDESYEIRSSIRSKNKLRASR